ncbi:MULTISPECIES: spinster family MFS transporter [Brevundimonas]|jgi:MFS family permease|uniref:spinster family MFS transporter n=1 Tax=Brevundimonas TaxID=41275 RepID=UPI00190446E1|nr:MULTISPECIES: MFS transporter [Brevundimonas]MBK1975897.1 MFS transporter [Brevundimonas diminuta]MDA0744686.1 MFS transporter [Pseudomonadota bacterium]MDM8352376.1 MFS transporter [Brevundimonas diminuta]
MSQIEAAKAEGSAVSPGYRYYVLAILIFVYMLNFVDRQIIGILAAPLKQEFQLSDEQFGLLGGIAFASVYSTLAIPLAWLADRASRVWIMTGALTVWSGFTALCGVAGSFGQLFLFRMGVGVGEAGGVAPAYSLIADYFPPNQRARALAAFAFGIPLGTAGGTLVGGLLAAQYGWRTAFIVVGVLGVLVAPLLRLTVRDPQRGGADAAAKVEAAVAAPASVPIEGDVSLGRKVALVCFGVAGVLAGLGLLSLFGAGLDNPLVPFFGAGLFAVIGVSLFIARATGSVIMRKRSFWLLALGAASSSVCGYGVAGWLPLFFMRSFGLTLAQVSWYYAGIALIGGLLGIWLGGSLADKMARRSKGAYPLVPAVAFIISAPSFILAMNSPWLIGLIPGGGSHAMALALAFLIFLIPTGLNLAWLGPVTAAVQHLAPAPMRSTASAIFLLINNLLGLAVGFYYFGWMSDLLRPTFGDESLRWAIYTGMGFYLMASILLFGASRTLKKDWVD